MTMKSIATPSPAIGTDRARRDSFARSPSSIVWGIAYNRLVSSAALAKGFGALLPTDGKWTTAALPRRQPIDSL